MTEQNIDTLNQDIERLNERITDSPYVAAFGEMQRISDVVYKEAHIETYTEEANKLSMSFIIYQGLYLQYTGAVPNMFGENIEELTIKAGQEYQKLVTEWITKYEQTLRTMIQRLVDEYRKISMGLEIGAGIIPDDISPEDFL